MADMVNKHKYLAFEKKVNQQSEGRVPFWAHFRHPKLTAEYFERRNQKYDGLKDEVRSLKDKTTMQFDVIKAILDPLSKDSRYKQLKEILETALRYEQRGQSLITGWQCYKVEKMLNYAGIKDRYFTLQVDETIRGVDLKMDIDLFPAVLQQLADLAFIKANNPSNEPIKVRVSVPSDAPSAIDIYFYYRGIDPSNDRFFTIVRDGENTTSDMNPMAILKLAGEAMKCRVSAGSYEDGYFLYISHPLITADGTDLVPFKAGRIVQD